MSALYPSLEDMKVDQYQQAQVQATQRVSQFSYPQGYGVHPTDPSQPQQGVPTSPPVLPDADLRTMYPSLSEEYMGLRLDPPTGPVACPQPPTYNTFAVTTPPTGQQVAVPSAGQASSALVAPLTSLTPGLARANVTHGVREVILCKDPKGKLGLRVKSIDKGIFVQFVSNNSPAALAGLRFGDQILQVDGKNVAGYSTEKGMEVLKKANPQKIVLAVRDRPFERTITMHKDSSGHVGFTFHDNEITNIAKDTSAARNGLLIEHHILEVDGQNVVGMNTKELTKVFEQVPQVMTITIMPSFLYKHIIKCMGDSLMRKAMDRSIPEV